MDGKLLLRELRMLLEELTGGSFMDDFTSYGWLHQAAVEFTSRTSCLRNEQTILTVANQSAYTLNGDFLQLYLKNDSNRFYLKLYDGTSYTFITDHDYGEMYWENNTTATPLPSHFTVIDDATSPTRITGSATASGASSGGECTLSDSSAPFANVVAGDTVHNTTDGSDGIVLSKTSSSALVTALFDGTNNDWTNADSYVIQQQGRNKIVLDPAPSVGSYTITVPYVQRPNPVYSSYGTYRFPSQYSPALVRYAFWLYKYRDQEPQFGDAMYQYFEKAVRQAGYNTNERLRKKTQLRVNLKARR